MTIDDAYLLDLHARLVNIPSVFPDEKEIMLCLEAELTRLGFVPRRLPIVEDRFNLLVSLGDGTPVVCLNAHADTVPPSGRSVPEAEIAGNRIYGLGSADDKGSLAAMIAAVKAILESGVILKGRLDLLISIDEEGDARGVRSAVRDGYRCDMAITGEPTGLQMVPTHCGLVFPEIVTHGKSTHGSIPGEGINAIDCMIELLDGLRKIATDCPSHPLLGPATMSIGVIRGGDRPNRVPDRCEAAVDIRLVPPVTVDDMLDRIKRHFADWEGRAEYRITKQGEPLDTAHDSHLVRTLASSAERVLGRMPEIVGWRGWTEAEAFHTGLGIDAVVFGPGHLAQAHSAEEYADLEQVRLAARVYAETAGSLLTSNG